MFDIKRYTGSDRLQWDAFAAASKNATFLFDRGYMDYHHDRFDDFSLMFYLDGELYALLPANVITDGKDGGGKTLVSHQGLTYGGLITDLRASAADVDTLFAEMNTFLRGEGFTKVIYKPVPWIYHKYPAEEDLYSLFRTCHAQLTVRNIASVIDLERPAKWRRDRRYAANKAHTDGITVAESDDFEGFWKILDDNLMNKYGARPVHSLQEITLLKSRFVDDIRLFMAEKGGEMLGGTVIFYNRYIAHAQYISASGRGKHLHAVDALFRTIIDHHTEGLRYFDFGTSNEDGGRVLNDTLIYQKEGFGGRGVCYDTYQWNL